MFLHHSTGGIIWDAGVPAWFTSYNAAQGTSYAISDLGDPAGDNNPYDYWNVWVNHAGPTAYLGQSTLEMLTPQYDVIAFKHCFPVSDIYADTGVPDVTSPTKKTENYKLQYEALKTKLHSFPSNRFVIWTGAAELQSATSEEMALRARAFFDWVVDEWDEPGDNIYVWDFFDLETEGGIYLTPENGSSDSHPNATFAAEVAPLFCQRLVDVIRGVGDTAGTTGVPGSDGLSLALAGANPTPGPVRLRFSLPQAARVRLGIYDTAGRRVARGGRRRFARRTAGADLGQPCGRLQGRGVFRATQGRRPGSHPADRDPGLSTERPWVKAASSDLLAATLRGGRGAFVHRSERRRPPLGHGPACSSSAAL